MLSYVHHHNIPGAWNIVFTALDNIEVLKVSQNQKRYPTTRVKVTLTFTGAGQATKHPPALLDEIGMQETHVSFPFLVFSSLLSPLRLASSETTH
jgi:hypothetical protein